MKTNAEIARGQRGGVVNPIPDDCHTVASIARLTNRIDFILGQALGHNFFAADLAGYAGGHGLPVAADHRDAAHPGQLAFSQCLPCFGSGLVLQSHPADTLIVPCGENQAPASGLVEINRSQETVSHAVFSKPLGAA
jgi:hypothetical protein